MNKEELEKELKRLKEENALLKQKNFELIEEKEMIKQKANQKIYEINEKLNKALLLIADYQEKYKIERTRVFIPKGEKLKEIVINEVEEVKKENRRTNKGKKYKKRNFNYEKYVQEVRYIEPKEAECKECGSNLIKVSEKIRYCIEIEPAKIKVIKLIKISKKCPKCNKNNNRIYYPLNEDVLGSGMLTPSLGAYILYHKYELGIPFEHLSNHLTNSINIEISKQDLANYASRISKIFEPIYERMKEDLLNNESKVIHSDETTLVVSKKPLEDKDRKKSYMYVYTSSYYDKNQIRIYDFHETRSIEGTTKWLKGYNGTIICDNYEGYNKLKKENGIKLQKCWAHVRRRYVDIAKNLKTSERKKSKAYQILELIEKMFKVEKEYRDMKLLPYQIVERRKEDILPIKEEINNSIKNTNSIKGSALYQAINYTKECWDDLFTFIEDGYIEMTNNTCERAVKPFAIQRKVFQTSGSYVGARYTGKLFSIIQTCRINNVNIEKYINYVLENINKLPIEDLLPYSSKAPKN